MATEPNGTLIEIEDVHLRSLDQAGIIRYIERQIAKWPKNASVLVNNHECEFVEPPVAEEKRFLAEGNTLELLGDAELVVKVSKTPLDEDLRGISVYSNGVWHETTLAGVKAARCPITFSARLTFPSLTRTDHQSRHLMSAAP